MEGVPDARLSSSAAHPLWVDRPRAGHAAWYELFPRSLGGLKGAIEHLSYVADLGFDVVYLPPIHPIGTTHRKGRGNSLVAGPDDPGSPWAIGGPDGGHDAIDPELGTLADFAAFIDAAEDLGLEVALDYALQCSPDHPWVRDHPEWFVRRPDGSIRYAENPPKKYQDIHPINFWPPDDTDRVALWEACRDVLEHWIGQGVRSFRVDNPHTKPLAFWDWIIRDVHDRHPEVLFLAEAFTAPAMMAKLAEIGFSQSYTYFTWRHEPWELREYVTELTHPPLVEYMRPSFWPNTPDILDDHLRHAPPSAFALRFILAATLVPLYGIYSGYELCENEPADDTTTEYRHSEKYELRARDYKQEPSLAPLIRTVNEIRRNHPDGVVPARHPVPPQRQRAAPCLHARPRGRRPAPRGRHPGPAPGAGHLGATRPRRRRPLAGALPPPRRAHRRPLHLGGRRRLRASRPDRPARSRTSSMSRRNALRLCPYCRCCAESTQRFLHSRRTPHGGPPAR